ncbi:MAG: hypothetical protein WA477_07700 [Candidatus Sulfotelmatobacter sp.]
MDSGGPYLNAALLCEKVLVERDGVITAVRLVDRVTVMAVSSTVPAPELLPPSSVSFNLLIVLKSGVFKGTAAIKLVIHTPSGKQVGESGTDAFFEGDDRGVNLISPLQFQVTEDGLYWISVYCAEELKTRIPLRVIYQRVNQGSMSWPQDQ